MKKLLLLLTAVVFCETNAFAQWDDNYPTRAKDSNQLVDGKNKDETGYMIADTLFLYDGNRFVVGEQLKLGYGSNPKKDFQFITTSPASWFAATGNAPLALGSSWSNMEMTIKDFKLWGNKKQGKKWYIILGGGNIANYACEIREALDFGEVRTPLTEARKKQTENISTTQPFSVADELKKLKELLDSGVLTQEEFDAQKAKLLK